MPQTKKKEAILGAAIGTVLGSISALLIPKEKGMLKQVKQQSQDWVKKAKELGEEIYDKNPLFGNHHEGEASNTFMAGALVGAILGAGSALFLTPKSRQQFKKQVSDTYNQVAKKSQNLLDYFNHTASPKNAKKAVKKAVRKVVRAPTSKMQVVKKKKTARKHK